MIRLLRRVMPSFATATEATIELVLFDVQRISPITSNLLKIPSLLPPKSPEMNY